MYKLGKSFVVLEQKVRDSDCEINGGVFYLEKTRDFPNTTTGKWFFASPFDTWSGVFWFGKTKTEIKKIIKSEEFQNKYKAHLFDNESEAIGFLNSHEPEERKKLLKKHKDKSILDIPAGDLKKLGVLATVC